MLTIRDILGVPAELRCYHRKPGRAPGKRENPWEWEDAWARKRAEELRARGIDARLVRRKGEPLCVVYRVLPGRLEEEIGRLG
ncbi:hypothetical protein Adeg_0691 [Ammonifex degensii KC4]|uniref:Uncharacterized protein n=1 Tax=Ammonifex degensii (strain DSM 10501 / KC4) TaxID=429009 RepID=C9RC61_AMMDK|nr:hypothetical protein [Ammonifex degensii]ACX51838.1 hypothetical protein Adeg_0691 [Ammonifex degensii KC4]